MFLFTFRGRFCLDRVRNMAGLRILALADDLTGAMEVGAKFAAAGLTTLVCAKPCSEDHHVGVNGLVIDTETRHLPAPDSEQVIRTLALSARERGIRLLFKKTDSTLRGNIASELKGLAAAFPQLPVFYVPAYPAMGRTVRDGRLFVNGIPVSDSIFARDGLNPITESWIPSLISSISELMPVISVPPSHSIADVERAVYVFDGESERDLLETASLISGSGPVVLSAGPAGIAQYLAQAAAIKPPTPPIFPSLRNCLVVNGSRHSVSLEQIKHASDAGWLSVGPEDVPGNLTSLWAILELPREQPVVTVNPAQRTGKIISQILRQSDLDAMIVFGGDTAYGILEALGTPHIRSVGEVLPGVAFGRIAAEDLAQPVPARKRDLSLITKAGGFGSPEILCQIQALMTHR